MLQQIHANRKSIPVRYALHRDQLGIKFFSYRKVNYDWCVSNEYCVCFSNVCISIRFKHLFWMCWTSFVFVNFIWWILAFLHLCNAFSNKTNEKGFRICKELLLPFWNYILLLLFFHLAFACQCNVQFILYYFHCLYVIYFCFSLLLSTIWFFQCSYSFLEIAHSICVLFFCF